MSNSIIIPKNIEVKTKENEIIGKTNSTDNIQLFITETTKPQIHLSKDNYSRCIYKHNDMLKYASSAEINFTREEKVNPAVHEKKRKLIEILDKEIDMKKEKNFDFDKPILLDKNVSDVNDKLISMYRNPFDANDEQISLDDNVIDVYEKHISLDKNLKNANMRNDINQETVETFIYFIYLLTVFYMYVYYIF